MDLFLELERSNATKITKVVGYISTSDGNVMAEMTISANRRASEWLNKEPPKANNWVEVKV